jgi:hypothetical protein
MMKVQKRIMTCKKGADLTHQSLKFPLTERPANQSTIYILGRAFARLVVMHEKHKDK